MEKWVRLRDCPEWLLCLEHEVLARTIAPDGRDLTLEPSMFQAVLLELLAFGISDAALGEFVRKLMEPARLDALGHWTWTRRVTSSKPIEHRAWSDGEVP